MFEDARTVGIDYMTPDHGAVAIVESKLCAVNHALGDIPKSREHGKQSVQAAYIASHKEPNNEGSISTIRTYVMHGCNCNDIV